MPDQNATTSQGPAATAGDHRAAQQISVTPFGNVLDGQPECKVTASAQFTGADGTVTWARITLFQLDDGRIGAGVYPGAGDHGTVLRWDAGVDGRPSVIHWHAPRNAGDECGSPRRMLSARLAIRAIGRLRWRARRHPA